MRSRTIAAQPSSDTGELGQIQWVRARENNLRAVDLAVPANALVSLAGVSGSGKTSLLEDCLAGEAMRRHQVLSRTTATIQTPYFPLVDDIVAPYVVFVRQGVLGFNLRSTVGTVSGILQPLRQVLARCAYVCDADGQRIAPLTLDRVVAWCGLHRAGHAVFVLARLGVRVLGPLWPRIEAALALAPAFTVIAAETGESFSPEDAKPASAFRRSVVATQRDVYAVFSLSRSTPRSALEVALRHATALAQGLDGVRLHLRGREGAEEILDLADVLVSVNEDTVYRRPSTTLLSYNSRLPHSGRCLSCDGLGQADTIRLDRLVMESSAPIAEGGLGIPFDVAQRRYKHIAPLSEEIRGLLVAHGLPISATWRDLDRTARTELLHGTGDRVIRPLLHDGKPRGRPKPFRGLLPQIEEKLRGANAAASVLASLRERGPCTDCGGSRLASTARAVHFAGCDYGQILAMSVEKLERWLRTAATQEVPAHEAQVLRALAVLAESCTRLGLGYLSLDRSVTTLSGGESQRLRIAAALSTHMSRVCYALDEPTRGLHTVDASHIVGVLRQLVASGASVLVAEHNRTVVAASDHVVELGPGGGTAGGKVIYNGTAAGAPFLLTTLPPRRTPPRSAIGEIHVSGITLRTLHDQAIALPLGVITAITGVSGSGKTTLIRDVLVPVLARFAESGAVDGPFHRALKITGRLDRVVYVSQLSLSNNPRSSVLTKLGLGDALRDWFFHASGASSLGLSPESLNPNSVAGRCSSCDGLGRTSGDGANGSRCPACGGSRLAPVGLWARLENRTIAEWLAAPLDEMANIVAVPAAIREAAVLCVQLGLGHLSLGRGLPTLSGGEAQRLRIGEALLDARQRRGEPLHQVFVMDEPAAGLHPTDIARLLQAFDAIVSNGSNTLILVEHNLELVRNADWLIDLGPGAADEGGRVLWCGTVPDLLTADLPQSQTRTVLLAEHPISSDASPGSVVRAPALDEASPREVLRRFRTCLATLAGETDPDDEPTTARPAYAVSAGDGTTHGQHGVMPLLGVALPLYRLFAHASAVPGQPLYDEADLASRALNWASQRQRVYVGWHPLVDQAQHHLVTDDDLRGVLRSAASAGAHFWYDGALVRKCSASRTGPLDLHRVRFLLDPALALEEAVARAITLGQGWFSLLDPETGSLEEFTSRALHMSCFRVGQRKITPQVFDSLVRGTACLLCRGDGRRTALDKRLIVKDESRALSDDRFFTPEALDVLRSARRKRMAPAIARLQAAGLIDLSGRADRMEEDQRTALWFGFPDREFLRPGGDPTVRGDWFRFRGLYKDVMDEMWKGSNRTWSQRTSDSTCEVLCPRCNGTGLGWEARARSIEGVSMQTIKIEFDLMRLRHWLAELVLPSAAHADRDLAVTRLDAALRWNIGGVRCGAGFADLAAFDRLRLAGAGVARHELLGALAVVELSDGIPLSDATDWVDGLRAATRMEWVLDR